MFLYVSFTCIPAWAFAQLPIVNLQVADWVLTESGSNPGSFNVSRSGGIISDPLTVVVAVTGSATFINDYTPDPEMSPKDANQYWLVIPAGQQTLTLVITPVQDSIYEGDETVIFTLVEDSTYTVGEPPGAQLTLVDDELFVDGIFKDSFEDP